MKRADSPINDQACQPIMTGSEVRFLGCSVNHIRLPPRSTSASDQGDMIPADWISEIRRDGLQPKRSNLAVYLTNRTAEFAARNLLWRQGFRVIRVTDRHLPDEIPFHLIAWSDTGPLLCIRVRSPRKDRRVQEELKLLSVLAAEHTFPGELQYWVRSVAAWHRYRIYPGGAMQISDVLHA